MHYTIKNLIALKSEISDKINELNIDYYTPNIIAVSKTFHIDKINPLIDYGHIHFGENKVQEAIEKWTKIKEINSKLNIHMIGKLQTNKVKHAVKVFDYIHSVDNIKLARKISSEQKKINKDIKIFIQINIANEEQKSGVKINDLNELHKECLELNLNVVGLMCLPPIHNSPLSYFEKIALKKKELNLQFLSLGMSNDYKEALKVKSDFIRIGTKIFGERN